MFGANDIRAVQMRKKHTMFTPTLIKWYVNSHKNIEPEFSLSQVRRITEPKIRSFFNGVHVTDQIDGKECHFMMYDFDLKITVPLNDK